MLNMSDVVFNEEEHSYTRGEDKLSGITSLIHSILRLGIYPDAEPKVEQVFIPRAGYRGSCVHHAIQTLETLGVEETQYPAVEHETQDFGTVIFPEQDVQPELDGYKQFVERYGLHCIATEYTVDYCQFASQIDGVDEDKVTEVALEVGAEDVISEDGGFTVKCQPNDFTTVIEAIKAGGINVDEESSSIGLVPNMTNPVSDVNVAKAINKFVEMLEDLEDVQDVYTNMETTDEVDAALEAEG